MRASLNACLQDQTLPHASLFDDQGHLCCSCWKMISCASGLSATASATPKEGSQSAQTQPDASEEYLNSLAIHKLIFSSTACQCGTQKLSSLCLPLLGEPFPNKIFKSKEYARQNGILMASPIYHAAFRDSCMSGHALLICLSRQQNSDHLDSSSTIVGGVPWLQQQVTRHQICTHQSWCHSQHQSLGQCVF